MVYAIVILSVMIVILLAALIIPWLSGAVIDEIRAAPGDDNASRLSPGDVPYHLPKTVLQITIDYTIREEFAHEEGGLPQSLIRTTVVNKVRLQPLAVADLAHPVVLSSRKAGNTPVDLGLSVSMRDGILEAVNSTSTDRTAEVFESLTAVAGRLISTVPSALALPAEAAAKLSPPAELPEVVACLKKAIHVAYADLCAAATVPPPSVPTRGNADAVAADESLVGDPGVEDTSAVPPPDPEAAKTERVKLIDSRLGVLRRVLRETIEAHTPTTTERTHTITRIVDPTGWLPDSSPICTISLPDPYSATAEGHEPDLLIVPVDLRPSPQQQYPLGGVPYRVARQVRIQIHLRAKGKSQLVLDEYVPLAQFGPIATTRVQSRRFSSRTTAMEFSATSGGLKQLKHTSTSAAQRAATAIQGATDSVSKQVGELRKVVGQGEGDRLTKETNLIKARTNLLTAQRNYERVKAGKDSLPEPKSVKGTDSGEAK